MSVYQQDFEQRRTPRELRTFVELTRAAVRADEGEFKLGLGKVGLYKEFLDELVPLSWFALLAYPDDYEIQLVLGNQGYDALVFDQAGQAADRIELAMPQDGRARAVDNVLVASRGHGEAHVGKPGSDLAALSLLVLKTCRSKGAKDYTDCTLVIAIDPLPPFHGFEAVYEKQIAELVSQLCRIDYRAKRVFLLILPSRLLPITSRGS